MSTMRSRIIKHGSIGGALLATALSGCAAGPAGRHADVASAKATQHRSSTSKADKNVDKDKKGDKPEVTFTIVSDFSPTVFGAIERRARTGQTRGHDRAAMPFEIADLPAAVLNDPFEDKDAPTTLDANAAPEITVTRSTGYAYGYTGASTYNTVMVASAELNSGTIRVGPQEGTFAKPNGTPTGGLVVQCAPWGRIVSMRWEGLHAKSAGSKDHIYEIADGWFDLKQCRGVVVRRSHIALAEVIPETLYAFRQCTDAACSDRTGVSLVVPNASNALSQSGPLRGPSGTALPRFLVPVKKGSSESVMAVIPALERNAKQRTLEVEISQGTADDRPLATAFIESTN